MWDFDFWKEYGGAVDRMLSSDRQIIENNPTLPDAVRQHQLMELDATRVRFDAILDETNDLIIDEVSGFVVRSRGE